MAGIPEYWLVDVDQQEAAFYVLHSDNLYHSVEPDANGVYHSAVVKGFELTVASLWRD